MCKKVRFGYFYKIEKTIRMPLSVSMRVMKNHNLKHIARWQQISTVKADAFYSLQKIINVYRNTSLRSHCSSVVKREKVNEKAK
jgi:hypothetical protein